MMKWLLLTLIAFQAQASNLSRETRSCVFRDVIAIGASVTAGMAYKIPGARVAVAAGEYFSTPAPTQFPSNVQFKSPLVNGEVRSFGPSPVVPFLYHYTKRAKAQYLSKWFTQNADDLGSSQIFDLIEGNLEEKFNHASMIIGIDAFYWDAVWNTCNARSTVRPQVAIELLTTVAKEKGLTVILGTVPVENAELVRIDSARTGVNGWYPPNGSCAIAINHAIRANCQVENNCYIVDLKAMVDDLNCGTPIQLQSGKSYGLYEMRPDGVHLSDVGSQYIAEQMISALEVHPPTCKAKAR